MDPFDQAEEKFLEWLTILNDAVGVLCFTIAITAITSEMPTQIASLGFAFVTLWAFFKGQPFRKYIDRANRNKRSNLRGWKPLLKSPAFVVGYGFLSLVALGIIQAPHLEAMSFARFAN